MRYCQFLKFSQTKGFEMFECDEMAVGDRELDEEWLKRLGYTDIKWIIGNTDYRGASARTGTIEGRPHFVVITVIADSGEYIFCDNQADLFALQLKLDQMIAPTLMGVEEQLDDILTRFEKGR